MTTHRDVVARELPLVGRVPLLVRVPQRVAGEAARAEEAPVLHVRVRRVVLRPVLQRLLLRERRKLAVRAEVLHVVGQADMAAPVQVFVLPHFVRAPVGEQAEAAPSKPDCRISSRGGNAVLCCGRARL